MWLESHILGFFSKSRTVLRIFWRKPGKIQFSRYSSKKINFLKIPSFFIIHNSVTGDGNWNLFWFSESTRATLSLNAKRILPSSLLHTEIRGRISVPILVKNLVFRFSQVWIGRLSWNFEPYAPCNSFGEDDMPYMVVLHTVGNWRWERSL